MDVDDTVDVYASVDGDLETWLAAGFVERVRRRRREHRVFGVLAARGIAEMTIEIDVENVASRRTIEPLGARMVGTTVEVVRHRIA